MSHLPYEADCYVMAFEGSLICANFSQSVYAKRPVGKQSFVVEIELQHIYSTAFKTVKVKMQVQLCRVMFCCRHLYWVQCNHTADTGIASSALN